MDVTKSNFYELLPSIIASINESTFVSIDTELTGLVDSANEHNALDTPSQFYKKVLKGSMNFICVQFGLAVFKLDKDTQQYSCKTYNFYTFPRPEHHYAPDTRFLCQASSIEFLVSNGFDFNKLFREGISYMNVNRHSELSEIVAEKKQIKEAIKNSGSKDSPSIKIPPQHKKVVEEASEKLSKVIDPDCPTDEVKVDGCNGFIRKLIYQTLRERYTTSDLFLETKDGVMISRKGKTEEELEEDAKNKEKAEQESLLKAAGFTDLIRALSNSGKLIVGHNMVLDVCHVAHHFMLDLPDDYAEFKEQIHSIFPWILDTKHLASCEELKEYVPSTVLPHLYQRTSEQPFVRPNIEFEEGYGYTDDFSKFHDAGYDAFVTGVTFISMYNYLADSKNPSTNFPVYQTSKLLSPLVKKYTNRLHLMRTPDTHINLDGDDPEPCREHIFHLTFPKTWIQQNIVQLFSPYGNVKIWWLTDTTAWVSLTDKREVSRATKALCEGNSLGKGVSVVPYSKHSQGAPSPRVPVKRRPAEPLPTSPGSKRRRSSWDTSQRSIDPIPEESEESENSTSGEEFKERCIAELEKGANDSENWG